jgi:glycosyltransferase involved in cell wall biosynthesis
VIGPTIKLLTFSSLYPSVARPQHGIFVETRLRHVLATGAADSRVVCPVPWFPWKHSMFGSYASFARTPSHDTRHGVSIDYPRYLLLPRVGMTTAPLSMAVAALSALKAVRDNGYNFNLIDAHYFYPDGVAAAWLARRLGKPVVITARGTDLNLIPEHRLPRRMIQWAAGQADAVITVCQALKDTLVNLGVPEKKVRVLRNGVDLKAFHPVDRQSCRARLGLNGTTLLSVGHLVERKGHHLAIEALAELPGVRLLIAGDGEERGALQSLAGKIKVVDRVTFLGAVPQQELKHYYSAVDALVLASSREGWANVLLEAMACGTPVIATNVWGTPEVVRSREAGVLMEERSARALVQAYARLFADYPSHDATRRYAEQFGWEDTTRGQLALFSEILTGRREN